MISPENTAWDHPRVGGEKDTAGYRGKAPVGSPPRGRGKGIKPCYHRVTMGITPAWAGKSARVGSQRLAEEDHPRVGGEKILSDSSEQAEGGSPPRGRGKARLRRRAGKHYGITPAWAGKSSCRALLSAPGGDHPRVGGEKAVGATWKQSDVGSPPRGRGKDTSSLGKGHVSRITPAWAGKSPSATLSARRVRDHPRVGGEKTKKIP